MRVLQIDDYHLSADTTRLTLACDGIQVETAASGTEGVSRAMRETFDAIILDLHLPDIDGFEVVRRLRASEIHTPILALSGDANTEARVALLRLGADDFMLKPYSRQELSARLRAIVRRAGGQKAPQLTIGKVVLDTRSKTAHASAKTIDLTASEYALLELFAQRKGSVLPKSAIMNHLYSDALDPPTTKIVDVFVCKLRKKLTRVTGENYIQTIWGCGYQMTEPAAA